MNRKRRKKHTHINNRLTILNCFLSLRRVLLSHCLGNCLKLNIGGSFINRSSFGITVETLNNIITDETVTAQPLDGLGSNLFRNLTRKEFSHRGISDEI